MVVLGYNGLGCDVMGCGGLGLVLDPNCALVGDGGYVCAQSIDWLDWWFTCVKMIELLAVEAVKGHKLNIVESAPRNEVEELAVRVRDIFSSQGWDWVAGWERGWGRGWRRGGADHDLRNSKKIYKISYIYFF